MNTYRFYIFTGKGGVGKTTAAMAFTKHLQNNSKKVKYGYDQIKPYWIGIRFSFTRYKL